MGLQTHGAKQVVTALTRGLPRLKVLDLKNNDLGDKGVAALAASPSVERLALLDLYRTGYGPAGGKALASSKFLAKCQVKPNE